MPKVWNRRRAGVPEDAVPIERGTEWGNPFRTGTHGTRAQVIQQFKRLVLSQPDLVEHIRRELRGRDLACCCKPKLCHGDVLLEIANSDSTT